MKLTITSRTLGKTLTFSRPGDYYIYIDEDGDRPGTLGDQITENDGATIGYRGDDQAQFERVCRRYYNAWMRAERKLHE